MKRKDFKDPFGGRRGCYHFSSSHSETQNIFRSDEDFIFAVNTLALLLPGYRLMLLAYCVMSNHLHLLLVGRLDDCLGFYDRLVHRISQRNAALYGMRGCLRCDGLDIVAVLDDQQLKREICYIHRNPYKARIASPQFYPWSSADVYFNTAVPHGESVRFLKIKERERMFKTHGPVPEEYEYASGRILNVSFVAYEKSSAKFRDSVEYFDYLRRYNLEAEVEEEHGIHESIVYSDSDLMERMLEICRNEFHQDALPSLDRRDVLRLAGLASMRFGARQKQLSRLLGISKEVLDRIL